ncbi:MAG: TetR/AcrR family transcriptional regulator [Candidatus Omnitrophota bacterium]
MGQTEKDFSLREKKYAKTKMALANAFIGRLQTTRFTDISIKEVCESVEVSEGTFFNYFPQKIDVALYYKQIVGLKISYQVKQNAGKMSAKKLIQFTFDIIAKEVDQPYLFYEFISLFTAEKKRPGEVELAPAEKFYANPDYEGIEDIPVQSLEDTFFSILKEAKRNGELKSDVKLEEAVLALMAILVGVPLAIDIADFGRLKEYYRAQVSLVWTALEAQ